MEAKWRLAKAALVSGHRCSAGWSSGEYGGRKSKWTWSGTRSLTLACLVCPAGAIQDEDDLLGGSSAHLARELGQFNFKDGDADGRGQMKDGPPRGGMDEADEVAPGEAVLHGRERVLAVDEHHTLCRMGFKPMRCSSTAQSSTRACGKAVATTWTSGRRFF
jgi:hypothetical protein